MSKMIVCGITQIETIVKVPKVPIQYQWFTSVKDSIFTAAGGDAFNISLAMIWLGDDVDFMTVVGKGQDLGIASRSVHVKGQTPLAPTQPLGHHPGTRDNFLLCCPICFQSSQASFFPGLFS